MREGSANYRQLGVARHINGFLHKRTGEKIMSDELLLVN